MSPLDYKEKKIPQQTLWHMGSDSLYIQYSQPVQSVTPWQIKGPEPLSQKQREERKETHKQGSQKMDKEVGREFKHWLKARKEAEITA